MFFTEQRTWNLLSNLSKSSYSETVCF